MWLRIIGKVGNSNCVVLPRELLRGIEWKRGDYLSILVVNQNKVMLEKVDLAGLSDTVLTALSGIPNIKHE